MKFYHETFIPQVGACAPRSYYIPFPSEKFSLRKEDSPRVTLLSRWRFGYFPHFSPEVLEADLPDEREVPFSWQVQGYDAHQYSNFFFPIPFDPPYVRKENPCGVYKTHYEKRGDERHFLVFEGVDSCLYLFVNGEQAGYSTVSHSSAEFDVTDFLREGDNELCVLVFKWCAGTYFEDQDKLRMSGIFRDVYMIRRPEGALRDYTLRTDVEEGDGLISFSCDKRANVRLYEGERLLGEREGRELSFRVEKAKLWTSETPFLYRLVISCCGEFIEEQFGFRKIAIENGVFTVNGKPVKLKGVNRHSMTAEGYVEPFDLLEKDVRLLKRLNINAVRTAHYPPHPLFPILCERAGIYLVEEADIETHGLETIHYYGDPRHFDDFANDPALREVYLHRQKRMYERDKNRTCVIIWSLGNEAGWGENFKACSDYLHAADTRPVHYEGNTTRLLPEVEWRDEEYLDVASRMYPDVEECKRYVPKTKKPFMLCEYSHAMGNSCGDLKGYWDYIYQEPRFLGAFVWEWCNHTALEGGKILFGGDFHEKEPCSRYDGNFCVDGLVDTDRRLHPSAFELKEVYAPVDVEYHDGTFVFVNRYDFLSLDGLVCTFTLEENGVKKREETVPLDMIPARGRKEWHPAIEAKGYTTCNFVFTGQDGEVARRQIVLSRDYPLPACREGGSAERTQEGARLCGEDYTAVIGGDGMLSSLLSGEERLKKPAAFCLYRAPLDNDLPFLDEWKGERLEFIRSAAKEIAAEGNKVRVRGKIVADIVEPLYDFELEYTAYAEGIGVRLFAVKRDWVKSAARFGFQFVLDEQEEAEWFGRGRGEAYPDRLAACPVGRYSAKAGAMNFGYIKPQDSGSRCGTRLLELTGKRRLIIASKEDFAFTVTPYEFEDYKRHLYEMGETGKTVLHIDAAVTGVGSAACGAALPEEFIVNGREVRMDFLILVK